MELQKFTNLYISKAFCFDFVLILLIPWKTRWLIQDDESDDVIWCQMTSLLANMCHFVEQPQGYLLI